MQKSVEDTAQAVSDYFKTNYNRLTKDENSYVQKILKKLHGEPVTEESKNLSIEMKHQGNALYNEQKYNEALEKYNKAIEADPYNYIVYSNRALTYVQLGKIQEAIQDCTTGIEYEPTFAKFYIRLAKIYWSIDKAKSMDYVRKGLEYEPKNEVLLDLQHELVPEIKSTAEEMKQKPKEAYESMFENKDFNAKAKEFFKGWTPQQVQDWMTDAMKK